MTPSAPHDGDERRPGRPSAPETVYRPSLRAHVRLRTTGRPLLPHGDTTHGRFPQAFLNAVVVAVQGLTADLACGDGTPRRVHLEDVLPPDADEPDLTSGTPGSGERPTR